MGGNRKKPTPKKRSSKRKSSRQKRSSVKKPTDDAEAKKRPDPEHAEKLDLSPRRRRQLEAASGVRSRSLPLGVIQLLHDEPAVRSLRPANWKGKWRHICEVNKATLGEVVALSLGYEPGQSDLAILAEYRKRLELAMRRLYDSHRFPGTDFSQSPIDLTKFAALAKAADWDIPPEMAALARRVSEEQKESQARGEGPNVPDEPEASAGKKARTKPRETRIAPLRRLAICAIDEGCDSTHAVWHWLNTKIGQKIADIHIERIENGQLNGWDDMSNKSVNLDVTVRGPLKDIVSRVIKKLREDAC